MYIKDPKTGMVYNTNESEYRSVMALRERVKREKDTLQQLSDLRAECMELKQLLTSVIKESHV